MNARATRFVGGSLDGQERQAMGAHWYYHPIGDGQVEQYQRVRAVYIDDVSYANSCNQELLSHLEYVFVRTQHEMDCL